MIAVFPCPDCLLSSEDFMLGKKYVKNILYHPHSYPNNCIGPVTIINGQSLTDGRNLFVLICHPEISKSLVDIFKLSLNIRESNNMPEETGRNPNDILCYKLDFAIFSLNGPLSSSILQKALKLDEAQLYSENQAITNVLVKDPRFHIPYKKQNPFCMSHQSGMKNASKWGNILYN